MKFNKKYCLLFLMTVLVLLLGAGMVSASEAGGDVQVIKDNQVLSTPNNYDVDNVVQPDVKSGANVEKTSTKDDAQNNSKSNIDTFVNTSKTNDNTQTITSGNCHSAKVSVNEISGRTITLTGLENSGILQESIDVKKISVSDTNSMSLNEDMTPIFKDNAEVSSNDGIDINTKSNNQLQETDKTIVKENLNQNVKTADGEDSDERYSVIVFDEQYQRVIYQKPWLMNDTTWVFSLGAGENQGSGANQNLTPAYQYSSKPVGIYKRIKLTDDYEIIHPITGENILPYVRTLIYNNFDIGVIGSHSNDLQVVVSKFSNPKSNYTNINSLPSQFVYNGTIRDYVNRTINQVQSGNAVNSSGKYKDSDFLTYQFYLYKADEELNEYHHFDAIGFQILSNINVKKIWNDTNHTSERPDNVTVKLYADGNNIKNITLNESNDWKGNFTDLPVYAIDENPNPLNSSNCQITVEPIELVDLNIRRTSTGTWYYNITANGESIMGVFTLSSSSKSVFYRNLPKYDSNGNEIVYGAIRTNSAGKIYSATQNYFTVTTTDKTGQNITIQVYNKSENETMHLGLYRNGSLCNEFNASGDNYTFAFLRADSTSSYELVRYDIMHVVNYTIGEVADPDVYDQIINVTTVDIGPLHNSLRSSIISNDFLVYKDNLNPLVKDITIINTYPNRPKIWDNIGLKYITSEDSKVSDANYSTMSNWYKYNVYYYWDSYALPFLMNDTTWAYCIEPSNRAQPNGLYRNGLLPGSFKRLTLTNEKIIHPVTGEDILPYLRTALYYHFNDTENFTVQSGGKPQIRWLLYAFTGGYNYTDPNAPESKETYKVDGPTRMEFVREIMDLVKSGKGINNTGSFYGSDYLTYQFYIYYTETDNIEDHYQNSIGFNILTKINVSKDWKDFDNIDNTRPDNITIDLLADKVVIANATLDSANGWKYNFTDLPVYKIYNEEVKEPDFTVTTTTAEAWNVTVKLNWIDGTPTADYVIVYPIKGQQYLEPYLYLSEENDWTGNIILPVYNYRTGAEITNYNFRSSNENATLVLTNVTISDGVKNINVKLNNEALKEEWVTVAVTEDGYEFRGELLNTENPECTFADLINYDEEGNEINYNLTMRKYEYINVINYTINETGIPGEYTVKITNHSEEINPLMPTKEQNSKRYVEELINPLNNLSTSFEIVNTYELTNLTVKKVWDDSDDKDGLRPKSIQVHIYSEETGYDDVIVLNQNNNWTKTITKLQKYGEDSSLIQYNVEELEVPNEYAVSVKEDSYNFTITNTHIPEMLSISVEKVWNDSDDIEGFRPSNVTIIVLANGEQYGDEIILTNETNWSYNVTGLPKYLNGKLMNYTIEEIVPEHYNVSYNISNVDENKKIPTKARVELVSFDNYAITYRIFVTNLTNDLVKSGNIEVIDKEGNVNATGELSEGYVDILWSLSKDFEVTVYYLGNDEYLESNTTIKESEVLVEYMGSGVLPYLMSDGIWGYCIQRGAQDPNNEIGFDGDTPVWMPYKKIAMTNETIMNPRTHEDVLPYIRTLLFYHAKDGENFTLMDNGLASNINDPSIYVFLEGNRTHSDGRYVDTHYEDRSTYSGSVGTAELNQKQGDAVYEVYQMVQNGNAIGNKGVVNYTEDGKWMYQFYLYKPLLDSAWQSLIGIDYYFVPLEPNYEVEIINTHIPENVTINVTKVWKDTNNQDGMRPVNVTVALFKDGILNDTIVLNESNGWMGSFTDLPKYANARLINYTVNETKVPVNYTQEVSNVGNNYTITNTHIPLVTSLNVTKKWDDKNNTDGKRPDVILVQLYANNVTKGEPVALYGGNNWIYVFENLDKYSNGVLINYTVDEVIVPEGYTKTVTNKSNNFTIKNTHVPELINVTVKKIWNDNNNQDGLRPEGNDVDAFIVYLYKNNKSYKSYMLSDSNNWTYTFRNVPKYEKGSLVNYTVIEKNRKYIDGKLIFYDLIGYTADINRQGDNFTITNTHIPELTNVSVVKVWNDSDDVDGLRPESIAIVLNANGEKCREAVLNSDNHWNCTFVDLPVYKDGVKIRYAVEEPDVPEGYQFGISITDYNITVTNTHIQENLTLNVTKVWNDTDDKDGLRPENITVELLANGEVNQTVVLDSSMNWTYSFTDLRVYKDGKIINYTINEMVPEGYTVSYGEIVPVKVDTNISLGLLNITRMDDLSGTARFIVIVKDQYNEYVSKGSILVTDSEGNLIAEEELENGIKYINVPVKFDAEKSPYGNNLSVPGMEFDVVVKYEENDLYSESTVILTNITDKLVVAVVERNATEEGPAYPSAPWKFSDGQWVYCADPAIPDWHDTDVDDPDEWIDNYPVPYIKVEVNNETVLNGYLPYEKYGIPFDEKSLEYYKILLYYFAEELDGNGYTHDQYAGTQEILQILTGYWTRLEENYFFPNGNYYPKGWYMINNTGHGMPDLITVTGKPLSYYVNKTMELYESGIRVPDHGIRNVTSEGRWEYQFNIYYPYQYYFGVTTYQRTFGLEYTFISGKHDLVTNLTNTHIVENISINVTKDWNDTENQDGVRPNNITVTLYVNGKANQTVQINATNWTYTFKDLPKYLDGALVNYTISEKEVSDYTTSIVVNVPEVTKYDGLNVTLVGTDSSITIINTHIPEKVSVNVTKVWDDANNTDGLRPDSILVQLYADNVAMGKPVALYGGNNWTYVFENLDKYSNGVLINYAIDEVIVPKGYSKNVTNTSYNFTINNTHIPEKTTVNVTKVWDDVNNTDGLRPVSVNITLVIDGKKSDQTVQINGTNWTYTFENLPKYRDNGTLIKYNVTEEKVENYETTIVFCEGIFKVINSHIPENTSVNVTKVWNDNNNQDGVRPANVTVQLLRDGKEYNSTVLSENNNWYAVFNNLPKYHDEGKEYKYTIMEVAIPGYSGVVTNVSTEFTVNNTHIPENTSVNVSKVWNDAEDNDALRPNNVTITLVIDGVVSDNKVQINSTNWNYTFENLPKYRDGGILIVYNVTEDAVEDYTTDIVFCEGRFKVINTHVPEVVNKTVNKVWDDADNRDNMRPSKVTIKLKSNDGNEYVAVIEEVNGKWNYTFTDLPKYANGKLIEYTVEESVVPEGYTVEYKQDTLTITNTHELLTKEINVTKVWNDSDTAKDRPENITVFLLADNEEVANITLKGSNWTGTFSNLPVYRKGSVGVEIVYIIKELGVASYTTEITNISDDWTITNTHIPEFVDITINKVWDDNDNQDGLRNNVTIILKADGVTVKNGVVQVNSTEDWTYTFTNLPKYANGKEIVYNVSEVNVPTGYNVTVDGLTITNTHIPENTSINISKVWDDANNTDGKRVPVTVHLLAEGNEINSTVLTESNDWKDTFVNLPKYSNGQEIVYTVSEDEIEGYTSTLVNCNGTYKFINTHTPELVNITVNKVWNDADNQDDMRPKQVTIRLKSSDGKTYVAVMEGVGNKWNYTFTDLPKYSNGEELVYTIEEASVPEGYTVDCDNDTFTITNTHKLLTKEINVAKVWDDNNNNDGVRPTEVTIDLYADSIFNKSVTLKGDNWTYTFTNLTVYKAGKVGEEIVYTIKEHEVANYTSMVSNIGDTFTVTNTHNNSKINLTISKKWEDSDDNDHIRPNNVTVRLLADGEEYKVVIVSGNDWTYTFKDLPEYDNKEKIVYTIEEVNVPAGYNASVDGLTITNTHENITKQINVTKVWNDNNDNDNARTSVVVELLADGVKIDETTLTADNDWKDTFKNLPVNKDGKAIVYTIGEVSVDHYLSNITECNGNFIITNTLVPELVNVTVNKEWNDSDNQDGIRPEEVTLKLKADGKEYVVKVVKATGNKWSYTFTDLPKYSNGKEIVYTVEEVNIAKGYTVSYSEDTLFIVNTHVPELTEVNVIKVWNDAYDNDGKRPGSVTVDLLANGKVVDSFVLDDSNNWKHTFAGLAKYDAGSEIVYSVSENNVPSGYTVNVVFCEGVFKVVNNHILENTSIGVSKVWEDNNDQDAIRPESVSVQVFADGEEYRIVKLTGENDWKVTVTGLPKYSNGHEIVYTVGEAIVPKGYTSVVDGLIITNTHIPEVVSVNVSKVWKDNNNNDGKRPGSVTVELLANGEVIDSVELDEANDWKHTFAGLAKYDAGSEIVYTVSEDAVEGYVTSIVNCNGTFKVINSHEDSTTEINITKEWNDNDNQDGIRPENVTVEVLANGERYDVVVINSTDDWKITIKDLPEFIDGQKVVYTVREIRVAAGYTTSVDGFTITNSHEPFTKEINVTKIWNDNNNNDGKRPNGVTVLLVKNNEMVYDEVYLTAENDWKHTFKNLPVYENGELIVYTVSEVNYHDYNVSIVNCGGNFKIINSYVDSVINITVNKVWNDSDNNDAIRPKTVSVRLLADGAEYSVAIVAGDDWTYTFENLPEYRNGNKIIYTIEEVEVPAGYTVVVDGLTIVNSHEVITKNITVNKVWSDDDNNDGLRPASVTVHLLADGVDSGKVVVLDASNNWTDTFTDLSVNNAGKAINYSISEVEVDGYDVVVKDCCGNFKLINTHEIIKINITVNKVWDDGDNNDAIRPKTVSVRLLADGNECAVAAVGGEDWTYTFHDLPKYNNGEEINYTVEEVEVPAGYTVVVDGLTIVNSHEVITKNISVNKVWSDDDNNDGLRPASVTVHLTADNETIETVTLTADNNWRYIFHDLPVNKDGVVIVYNISEDKVDSYIVSITNNEDNFTVTNTHDIIKINLTVNKVWDDSDNNDGIRPDSVTVILSADDKEVQTVVVKNSDDWKYTFLDLPKYNNGKEIVYTVNETEVSGYTTSINGLTIINSHENITKDIDVSKVWDDNNNNDGIRPASVSVDLLADGEKIDETTLSAENGWKATFKNLMVNKKGKAINYTIRESTIPEAYSVRYDGYVIINTHVDDVTEVTVSKVWNDSNNNDAKRPDSVTVHLMANGEEIDNPVLLSSNNNWIFTFKDLPKFDNGQEIVYTVVEDAVEGYTTIISGTNNTYIITNTHENETVDLNVSKVWDDLDDKYAKRPDSITVNVYANGTYLKSVNLTKDTDWKVEISNLTKYNNGTLIKYSVNESKVKYYNTTIESNGDYGFIITNKLKIINRTCVWAWKLIGNKTIIYINGSDDYDNTKLVPKYVVKNKAKSIRHNKGIGKYSPRHYYPKKNKKHYPLNRNKGAHSYQKFMTKEQYRLYIFLCQKCFFGNMSYSDFVAILKANGIDPVMSNAWNSSGILTFDYDDLEKVPDSIELHDNGGHVQDSSDNVEKHKPASSSGVIDEGKIKLEVIEIEE